MRVFQPMSIAEACAILAEHPGAEPLAGGTELLVDWPVGVDVRDRALVDLSKLPELQTLRWTPDALEIGGGVTFWAVRRDAGIARELPLLAQAAGSVGSLQIQTRATWAGNVAGRGSAADGVAVLLAHEAEAELAVGTERERVPIELLASDSRRYLDPRRALIVGLRVPRRKPRYARYEKVRVRGAGGLSAVCLVAVRSEAGWRVVAAGATPRPTRCARVEERIGSEGPTPPVEALAPAFRADLARAGAASESVDFAGGALARMLRTQLAGLAWRAPAGSGSTSRV